VLTAQHASATEALAGAACRHVNQLSAVLLAAALSVAARARARLPEPPERARAFASNASAAAAPLVGGLDERWTTALWIAARSLQERSIAFDRALHRALAARAPAVAPAMIRNSPAHALLGMVATGVPAAEEPAATAALLGTAARCWPDMDAFGVVGTLHAVAALGVALPDAIRRHVPAALACTAHSMKPPTSAALSTRSASVATTVLERACALCTRESLPRRRRRRRSRPWRCWPSSRRTRHR
jgi:hypothetical protein